MNKTKIYSYIIEYEDNAKEGIDYLEDDLDDEEARVFFDQARNRSKAEFEDDEDRQFVLTYRSGIYVLTRR